MGGNIATGDDAASASVNGAVGIYFASPMDGVSEFSFFASPSIGFDWEEFCSLSSAHSDGSIGLLAVGYDWAGDTATTLVDQSISLWSNNSWIDDASGDKLVSSFPLSASFQVDSDHFYALYVRFGMNDSADGFGIISGSAAISDLAVGVPSIGWCLGSF